ncbi:MAG: hypothetical protein A2172_02905 [Candidatus Woykebacteria bacterium RBG_13_40_15]|uniref:Glycosyltransferase 2-like domain-containing protein n=1 Tax=Candidatus Woykebacteria bacterium RBG_13_40_15 TaxID=1802593 RepID=A0A1G1W5C5_9BACT|nr:MAG: hypothetical protein A2172_02905 [Candidatus Woykebacteria bacterium RBG_13_40_15]
MIKASIVTTVLNEEGTIEKFIQALLNQSVKPDEIVICDGGSTDSTVEKVKKLIKDGALIKLITKPGNRSIGRNAAIKESRNSVIAVTDGGTVADRNWFNEIIKPFEDSSVMAVAGFFESKPETFFERIYSTMLTQSPEEIDPENWLPSARSIAFRREVWEKAGGYPEYTRYNEDTPFDIAVKKSSYKFVFAPKAVVYWRPRSNLIEFFKQYHNYAIGDGLDLISWQAYLKKFSIYIFGLGLFILSFWFKYLFVIFFLGLILFFLKRDLRVAGKIPKIETIILAPILTVTYDLAEFSGYLKGIYESKFKKD